MRVALIGASGFVGRQVFHTLTGDSALTVLPFARSTGNSWDFLRAGLAPALLDLTQPDAVTAALSGVDAVVNCSSPGGPDMVPAIRNLLAAAKTNRVARFVHISSVAVYGDTPAPESVSEAAAPNPTSNYGRYKLAQDVEVERAAKGGLSAVALCPPNILGPGSWWLGAVTDALEAGALPLLDGGAAPVSTVDVVNLAHAIHCALGRGPKDGRRLFVVDPGEATWGDVVAALRPLAFPEPRTISAAELTPLRDAAIDRRASLSGAAKRLLSGDLRRALMAEPWWAKRLQGAKQLVLDLPPSLREPLKTRLSSPAVAPRRSPWADVRGGLAGQQLRGVRHSSAQAEAEIGYRPPSGWREGVAAFRRWYAFMRPPGHAEGRAE